MNTAEFRELMERLARAWSTQDTELALECFTEDAVYMQPPDVQLYVGHDQLRPYFGALRAGTFMRFNAVTFDEAAQVGAGEFAFGSDRSDIADHGVAVVQLDGDRIAFWREYLSRGPAAFDAFLAVEGKTWQWHIENYP